MSGDEDPRRSTDYRQARIGAAAAILGVLVVILIADFLVVDYEASPITIGILVGALCAILGVEWKTPTRP